MTYRLTSLVLASFILAGCASSKPESEASAQRSDPFEGFNRTMFNFNYNVVDPYVLRPVAVAWRGYVPVSARTGLSNFLGNLEEPTSMVNAILVGDSRQAGIYFTRFLLNSVLGLGGFIDVAGKANPELAREVPRRFGSTLGHYGVGYGPYVELPAYGSFTIREDGGYYVDTLYPLLSWLTWPMSIAKWTLEGVETRAQLLDSDALLKQQSDPYAFIRNAYFQRHDFLANGGRLKPEENLNASAIQDDLKDIDAQ
ncbi:phospholipid-binding lipoprotein MlaA [Candidatus Pantoea persica]|uniref:phospholipid-binding lipoprotein MlaA n=1 Tax=Candidatus Pantoea persica TaxID=2518128 RepID=UPI00215DB1DA|nr:phospholipid-binding lipoprotein MlaA [Candidatus Pantoea persica]MBA2817012.1 putative phospholipid-binding lipoprotein MlaA precursor [Candidatus Pantoea persica]